MKEILDHDQDKPNMDPTALQHDHQDDDICRICQGGCSTEMLMRPCACNGSIRYSHASCLLQWITTSFNFHCEMCGTEFRMEYKGLKNIRKWELPNLQILERLHLLMFGVAFVMLMCSMPWLFWIRFSSANEAEKYRQSGLIVVIYIIYGIVDGFSLMIVVTEGIYTIWPILKKWWTINQELIVLSYKEPVDLEDNYSSEKKATDINNNELLDSRVVVSSSSQEGNNYQSIPQYSSAENTASRISTSLATSSRNLLLLPDASSSHRLNPP